MYGQISMAIGGSAKMLRVGAAALVLGGLMCTSALAAPMAGVNPELYPNQSAQSSTANTGAGDVLKGLGGQSNEVSSADLKGMSGGSGVVVLGDAQLNATDANSSASQIYNQNVNTGAIGDQKLSNVSGINTVMQNTGNGVVMQSINNVNIVLK
jgi:hypothetical protein